MSKTYFWKDEEVVEHTKQFTLEEAGKHPELSGCLCVDCYHPENVYAKFGMFKQNDSRNPFLVDWFHIPVDQFPKKFLVTLMLMDVPL